MGEASRSRKAILQQETRCIFCANAPSTVEHMPPRAIFFGKQRPSGMEFAACEGCNNGTKGADVVASVFARICPTDEAYTLKFATELNALIKSLDRCAPGLRADVFNMQKAEQKWVRNRAGLLVQQIRVNGNSPLLASYLAVFAAKMGMALYREHVGQPLPLDGAVHVEYFLNSGLSQKNAEIKLKMLPMHSPLEQGDFKVAEQFDYRYNCDKKSIVAALIHFHENLYFFVIATSEAETYRPIFERFPHGEVIHPGELLARLPKIHPAPSQRMMLGS